MVGPVGPGYAQSYRRERARELSVSGKQEAQDWAETVRKFGERNGLTYEPVGGINPKDGPVALCVGGTNRLTGQLVEGFWGACCDADEKEVGGLFGKAVLPTAILAKAHMPDLAKVVPAFNVESIEGTEAVTQHLVRKVEFESIDFNKRFIATVPKEYDPVALRELFSPGFLEWTTTMTGEIDFGVNDRQLWFLWRLGERTERELKEALKNAGQLFRRLQGEMDESGIHTYPPGPWHAGLEPFPDEARRASGGRIVRVAGEDDPVVLVAADDLRQDRLDRAVAVGGERLVGGREAGSSDSSCLTVGKARTSSPASCGVERRARLEPGGLDGLDPVGLRRRVGGGEGEEEPGVEAGRDHLRGDPAREEDQLLVGGQLDRRLLGQLAHRAGAVAGLALAVGGVDARRPGRPRRRA